VVAAVDGGVVDEHIQAVVSTLEGTYKAADGVLAGSIKGQNGALRGGVFTGNFRGNLLSLPNVAAGEDQVRAEVRQSQRSLSSNAGGWTGNQNALALHGIHGHAPKSWCFWIAFCLQVSLRTLSARVLSLNSVKSKT